MNLLIITFFFLICSVMCDQKKLKLSRAKRWNHGDMQNNGGMTNNGGMGNNGGMANNGDMSENFRGTAGVDYPNFKTIPQTSFRCDDKMYDGGMYADVETQCQVYHICHDGRKDSFICGPGTIFNQEILACDYWYSIDCDKAPSFYYVNSQIGNSGSSWQSPGESQQQGSLGNYQDGSYRSGNPNMPPQGGYDNSRTLSQPSGTGADYNSQNPDQKDCCCQKYSFKTPWAFPSS